MPTCLFANRADGGRLLAEALHASYGARKDTVVLALPRGGVPVGCAIAQRLNAPLDVFLVRKIGVPGFEELAMGAIASGGTRVLNEDVIAGVPQGMEILKQVTAVETRELERREAEYRRGRPPLNLREKTVILVDDGLATGASMRAAIGAVRRQHTRAVVVAAPVGPAFTCDEIRQEVDELVCLYQPETFGAVGEYYADFSQTTDDEVRTLLARSSATG